MTIEDAIDHCYEVAEEAEKFQCSPCTNDHLQLAKWLIELKKRREECMCQLSSAVEPLFCKQQVVGSIPTAGSKLRK